MRFFTTRFAQVNVSEKDVIISKERIPGLENLTCYSILKPRESHPIVWLQSAEKPEIALPVISLESLNFNYEFDLDPKPESDLELKRGQTLEAHFVV